MMIVCLPRFAARHLATLLLFAGAYGEGMAANQPDPAAPSRRPTAQELMQATAPGYATPAGMARECLGRLVFDVHAPVQWPTRYKDASDTGIFYRSFSEDVFHQGDEIQVGNVRIGVLGPLGKEDMAALREAMPQPRIDRLQALLKDDEAELAALKGQPANAKTRQASYLAQKSLTGRQAQIKELQSNYQTFDSGLPDSDGYRSSEGSGTANPTRYSIYRSHLKRGEYVYVFESMQEIRDNNSEAAHGQQFIRFLKSFRPRAANEVPKELGLCIPHGFIADDGKTVSAIQQSLRWPDAPGVLYTISTGNVDPRALKVPLVQAAATGGIGQFGSRGEQEAKPFIVERIAPRSVRIGALTAQQGGVALKVERPGSAPFETYAVFTGYAGWLGTAVLPYILIELGSRSMEQAPELKQNPPPFKSSYARLETLLKSTHLRPTEPAMPELRGLSGTQ
ncbi:T6SS immunity protein Tli4 family protein [Janthinobacterium lividum]|uniref:T6SS immunity protein Tli4 family protein n=1 Tax=Janthinobacterium lividum TaxID=29581 RepID=A0ABU0XL86_9BURK|nr:T6SS immunity protein Tli4 family protein [Janthinobacterium lividum]MDQ4624271.1 T6SS immunity protein Tli4 family protein [Janthinobacterium lividum]MDQ4674125.1 T6SS immunity protein Tli4 family protein [Janthinobacterium lividum]MDQ4684855.1 T6SS immunity protein Tli4 family protein [Janthinobacterium lividum]